MQERIKESISNGCQRGFLGVVSASKQLSDCWSIIDLGLVAEATRFRAARMSSLRHFSHTRLANRRRPALNFDSSSAQAKLLSELGGKPMRTFPILVVLIAITGANFGSPAATRDDSALRAELQAAYDRFGAALEHGNLSAAAEFLAPDFTVTTLQGQVFARAEWESRTRSTMRQVKTLGPIRSELQSLTQDASKIIVVVRTLTFYTEPGFLNPKQDDESFEDELARDTWIRTGKGLRLLHSEPLRNKIRCRVNAASADAAAIVSPTLARLAAALQTGERDKLAAFWNATRNNTPLIESIPGDDLNSWVTFIWRGDTGTKRVSLVGGLPQEGADDKPLTRLLDTDLWYRTEMIPKAARGAYAFDTDGEITQPRAVHFTATAPDLMNSNSFSFGSSFELPGAPAQPYVKERPGVPRGTLARLTMKSAILNEERSYSVCTPPGFDAKAQPYGLIVVFDGEVYGDFADSYVPTPVILDNMLAEGRIPPMVLVLVDSQNQQMRNRDLTCSASFADFLAKELVPHVRATYNVSSDPSRVIVAGSSFGGLCAAYCGLTHPEVFGNILSQSGSYWFTQDWRKALSMRYLAGTGWLIEQYAMRPKLPLRFYMEVGKFESGALQVATNRHLRDVLQLKGYPVVYSEFYGGHDYFCWRGSIADGLIALVGK